MEPIGQRLRQRREELGLALREVEAATRIRLRYLEAIEEDRFDAMPADVFAKGFLRAYATYLGLDANGIVADFNALRPSAEGGVAVPVVGAASPPGPTRRRRRRPRRVRWTLPVLLALLAAAGVALLHMRPLPAPRARKAGAVASAPATPPTARSPRPSQPAAPAPAASQKPKLVAGAPQGTVLPFSVAGASTIDVRATFSGRCWVRVWIDGVQQHPDVMYVSGRTAVWRAQRNLQILLGFPPAAKLTVNGTPLAIQSRNPRTLSLTLASS